MGKGNSPEAKKQHLSDGVFLTSQLPAALARGLSPTEPHPSSSAQARTLPAATARGGLEMRRGSRGHEGQDPKCKLSTPS